MRTIAVASRVRSVELRFGWYYIQVGLFGLTQGVRRILLGYQYRI